MVIRSRRSARRLVAVALLTTAGLAATACGGNDPSDTKATTTVAPDGGTATTAAGSTDSTAAPSTAPVFTNAPTTTAEAAPEPQSGGTLTVGIEGESTGYAPYADVWTNAGHNVGKAIFDTLAVYDASGKVVPYLAESITGNADATVWTIKLRSGISFQNGEPLTADAVRQNFQAILDSAQFKDQLSLLASMNVVDDLTLELTMSSPWGTFPNTLVGEIGTQVGYIAAPAMLASPEGSRNPIGTGPFSFVEWVPDDHVTVQRNDDYWGGPAYLDEVVFKPIADSTARKAAFDAGDIDVYYTGSSSEITEYFAQQDAGEVGVTIGAPSEPDVVMFNTAKAPLDDVRVRRALAMSVDIPRLYDYLEATGVKQPLTGPYAASSFWFVDSDYPAYDVEGAKQLIDEYEAEVGPVSFEFAGGQDPFITSYQELFQSMWSEIGAEANIVSRAQSENIDAVLNDNFQVILWGGIGGGDPDADYAQFHSGGLNFSNFTDPAIDAAMDAGRALSDPEARKEQYAIVQKILGEQVPYIWTGTNQFGVITKAGVNGIADFDLPDGSPGQPINGGRFYLKDVWLAA
ncbi:MAG: ABC transporter substrate-binding protein [Acidimicrobiales bacterium]